MSGTFQFKQFQVDQSGCAMKINTDGVLLGALAGHSKAERILDIGTGTGVIALMMAQRFADALIDAVEIDAAAAETAGTNFQQSCFAARIHIHPTGFSEYFESYPDSKYDLIVSNPPFYINSLEAAIDKKNLAKHTDHRFFDDLVSSVAKHLSGTGTCWLVLPVTTAALVKSIAEKNGLFVKQQIDIHSFAGSEPHRQIISLGFTETKPVVSRFIIYDAPKVYSKEYQACLKDFFTIF